MVISVILLRHRLLLAGTGLTLVLAGLLVLTAGRADPAGAQDDVGAVTGCRHTASAQVRRGPASGRRVALTFDDGPGPLTTQFLRILERERVPATFFVVGRNIAGREATLRRILAGGSTLGNHSLTHASLAAGDEAAAAELRATQAVIREVTGFTPCLMRPPYGLSSRRLVAAADAQSLTSVLWSVYPQDTRDSGSRRIRERVLSRVRPGSIVLAHDGGPRRQTLAALPGIIRALKARGYRFVTVTDLLGRTVTRDR